MITVIVMTGYYLSSTVEKKTLTALNDKTNTNKLSMQPKQTTNY